MHRLLMLLAFIGSTSAIAQGTDIAPPKGLEPLPEPPAMQEGAEVDKDPSLEPQVTIIKRGQDTVEEYRIGGKLYMVKVTPPHGVPYYLIDHKGDGQFTRQDHLDSGVRVPQWVLIRF